MCVSSPICASEDENPGAAGENLVDECMLLMPLCGILRSLSCCVKRPLDACVACASTPKECSWGIALEGIGLAKMPTCSCMVAGRLVLGDDRYDVDAVGVPGPASDKYEADAVEEGLASSTEREALRLGRGEADAVGETASKPTARGF